MAPFSQRLRCVVRRGVPQLMNLLDAARLTRLGYAASVPDGPVFKQLLFAEGLVGLGGVVGRPRSRCQDRAVPARSPVLTSQLALCGWYGVAQNRAQGLSLCDIAQSSLCDTAQSSV